MNKLLMSLAVGPEHEAFLALTMPAMRKYASRHGYAFAGLNANLAVDKDRPPSWYKIEALFAGFMSGADVVLWLDCDVAIKNGEKDILEDMNRLDLDRKSLFGCVVHHTKPHGTIPNAGVWIVRRAFAPYLLKMNRLDRFASSEHTWEQAALIHLMGADPDSYPISLPEEKPIPWTELPYEWNVIEQDERGEVEGTRFFHSVRGTTNRKERLT